ncbi:hypothetical protein PAPHI01_2108 [Pancytospora philotis]|nr:hypothetical protein PAPHI01_2108 [Pancytospora philotis]
MIFGITAAQLLAVTLNFCSIDAKAYKDYAASDAPSLRTGYKTYEKAQTTFKKECEDALKQQQEAIKDAKKNDKSKKDFDEKINAELYKPINEKVAEIKKNNSTIVQMKKSTNLVKKEDNEKFSELLKKNIELAADVEKLIADAKEGIFAEQLEAYTRANKEAETKIGKATTDANEHLENAITEFTNAHNTFLGVCETVSGSADDLDNEKEKTKANKEIEDFIKKAKDLLAASEKSKEENVKKANSENETAKKLYDVTEDVKKMKANFLEKINGKDHDEAYKSIVNKGDFLIHTGIPHVLWSVRESVVKKSVANVVDLQSNASKLLDDSKSALSADFKPAATAAPEATPAVETKEESSWFSSSWLLYGGIALAVFVVLGAGAYFFMGKSSA